MARKRRPQLPRGHPDYAVPRPLPPGVEHGTITAHHDHGCRCDPCRACSADAGYARRLEESLEVLAAELELEPWEVELERRARIVRRLTRAG